MWLSYCAGLLAALYVLTYADNDASLDAHCKDKPDGAYDTACRAYVTCTAGKATQMYCLEGRVFNFNSHKCDDPIHVPPPCGVRKDCTGVANGRYTDFIRKCKFYYTCNGGQFLGHNQCPGGLVFNETMGICTWAYDMLPPCGTKGT